MNNCSDAVRIDCDDIQILGIEYVPVQHSSFEDLFSNEEGLIKGTVFPELYLPFCMERGAR